MVLTKRPKAPISAQIAAAKLGRARLHCETVVISFVIYAHLAGISVGHRTLSKHGGSNVIRTVRSRGYALDFDD
jgi:hypothetical protein